MFKEQTDILLKLNNYVINRYEWFYLNIATT